MAQKKTAYLMENSEEASASNSKPIPRRFTFRRCGAACSLECIFWTPGAGLATPPPSLIR